MSELRWNPLLKTYTIVAANRQSRPNLEKNICPFCPGSGKVPDHYDVHLYANDFPALSTNASAVESNNSIYSKEESYGVCEVVLYSPEHSKTLPELAEDHLYKLVQLWTDRTAKIASDPKIKYVFVFENRGEEVGCTMSHPHGQIYGYPFVPLKLKTELDACKEYNEQNGRNMLLDINEEEIKVGSRLLFENDSFLSFLPFFTDYPYGVFISSKKKKGSFLDFTEKEKMDLAAMLKAVCGGLDTLFNKPFPYMMCVHQTPFNSEEYNNSEEYFNFHIEFYPPLRNENTIKFYASSEMGAWAATNTREVEDTAKELRSAIHKFLDK
ncbi:MAG: galactose-1-phosphate uridylyltransferase [Flavobacteriales bacterium]